MHGTAVDYYFVRGLLFWVCPHPKGLYYTSWFQYYDFTFDKLIARRESPSLQLLYEAINMLDGLSSTSGRPDQLLHCHAPLNACQSTPCKGKNVPWSGSIGHFEDLFDILLIWKKYHRLGSGSLNFSFKTWYSLIFMNLTYILSI